ncbi:RHS repeat domain-containing protein [Pseudomonas soli]|uniref:RHS repeat domain-containing protein n=1 Tax=Pseudomonas soli TaxID=1306993 RepID=UPI003817C7AB
MCCSMLVSLGLMVSGAASAGTVSYTYDPLGRVTQVVYSDGSTTTTISYQYDAAGNRTSVTTTRSP